MPEQNSELFQSLLNHAVNNKKNPDGIPSYTDESGKTYPFLGQGSFGAVYEDPDDPTKVFKIVQDNYVPDPKKTFYDEVDNMMMANMEAPGMTPQLYESTWDPNKNLGILHLEKIPGKAQNASRQAIIGHVNAINDFRDQTGTMQMDPHRGNYMWDWATNSGKLVDLGWLTKTPDSPESLFTRLSIGQAAFDTGGNPDAADIFYESGKKMYDKQDYSGLKDLVEQGESLYSTLNPNSEYTDVFKNQYPNAWKEQKFSSPALEQPVTPAPKIQQPEQGLNIFNFKNIDLKTAAERIKTGARSGLQVGALDLIPSPEVIRQLGENPNNPAQAATTFAQEFAAGVPVAAGIGAATAAVPALGNIIPPVAGGLALINTGQTANQVYKQATGKDWITRNQPRPFVSTTPSETPQLVGRMGTAILNGKEIKVPWGSVAGIEKVGKPWWDTVGTPIRRAVDAISTGSALSWADRNTINRITRPVRRSATTSRPQKIDLGNEKRYAIRPQKIDLENEGRYAIRQIMRGQIPWWPK